MQAPASSDAQSGALTVCRHCVSVALDEKANLDLKVLLCRDLCCPLIRRMRVVDVETLLTSPLTDKDTQPVLKSLTSILATPLTLTAPDELFVSKICAFMLLQVAPRFLYIFILYILYLYYVYRGVLRQSLWVSGCGCETVLCFRQLSRPVPGLA